jgi:ketosteroid isomerase-like protein
MNRFRKHLPESRGTRSARDIALAAACALCVFSTGTAAASDASDVAAVVKQWVDDFNKGDMKSFIAACEPSVSVIDGFPPYSWLNCADYMNDYRTNSKAIELTEGRLWIGKPDYTEVTADHAYVIYPATFSDKEKGKPVLYKGAWTMTLRKTSGRWAFTGSSSAWSGH